MPQRLEVELFFLIDMCIYIYIYIYRASPELEFCYRLEKKMQHRHWLASGWCEFRPWLPKRTWVQQCWPSTDWNVRHTKMSQYIKMKNNTQDLRLIYEHRLWVKYIALNALGARNFTPWLLSSKLDRSIWRLMKEVHNGQRTKQSALTLINAICHFFLPECDV